MKRRNFSKTIRKPKYYTQSECVDSRVVYPTLEPFYQFGIIDPGPKSCGLRIVRYNLISKSITLICFQLLSFGTELLEIIQNMEPELERVRPQLGDCHHILVEFQIMVGARNYQTFSDLLYALAVGICRTGPMKPVLIEMDPKLKTVILGGPRTKRENTSPEMVQWIRERTGQDPVLGTIEIKEWTKMRARKYSLQKGDLITYHVLENSMYKGNEDLSDTACYEEGWLEYLRQHPEVRLPFVRTLMF
jgi:hypothetical protein